mgnify:CR=1 FL=1
MVRPTAALRKEVLELLMNQVFFLHRKKKAEENIKEWERFSTVGDSMTSTSADMSRTTEEMVTLSYL